MTTETKKRKMPPKTGKQLRASQFNFTKYLLAGIREQARTLHRNFKTIDREALRFMEDAVQDALASIAEKEKREHINAKGKRP